ncbi:MAG: potassium-transporting ATPase subunit C [Acidimicrobiales bacterium]|nr:potassium-transporting ATPase subunit C [Acidimicrobiales bacterium]
MVEHIKRTLILMVVFILTLGFAYPLLGTFLSQEVFNFQANGSITSNGSLLIGQTWSGPTWFHGRPDGSLVTLGNGNVIVSGTNQPGPSSKALRNFVKKQAANLQAEGIIPTNDLVTPSGSLVDPDISPQDAYAQVSAISKARHLSQSKLLTLISQSIHPRELGFLGESYVDVLEINTKLANLG